MADWLEGLERLEKSATPGPWEQEFDEGHATSWVVVDEEASVECYDGPHDAAFIAALRNHAPRLIAIARAAEEIANLIDDDEALALGLRSEMRILRAALAPAAPEGGESMSDKALIRLAWQTVCRKQDATALAREKYYDAMDAEHQAFQAFTKLAHPVDPEDEKAAREALNRLPGEPHA